MFSTETNTPKMELDEENKTEGQSPELDDEDRDTIRRIGKLYSVLGSEKIDLGELENMTRGLNQSKTIDKMNYLRALLYPEDAKGCKIPSSFPTPTSAFQLHNSFTMSTNASGNFLMMINPYLLISEETTCKEYSWNTGGSIVGVQFKDLTGCTYINDDSLDGTNVLAGTKVNPLNIGQMIPDVYNQYRLVSASLVVKYIGRLDIASGVIGGAIINETSDRISHKEYRTRNGESLGTFIVNDTSLAKYSNFDLIMDNYYHKEHMLVEGIRELYFPVDDSYEHYVTTDLYKGSDHSQYAYRSLQYDETEDPPVSTLDMADINYSWSDPDCYKSGFKFIFYTLGGPASSACLKVDLYCNFECIPNSKFLNYMPLYTSVDAISTQEKREFIKYVQQRPIYKLNEDRIIVTKNCSGIRKLMKGLGNCMPGLGDWCKWGILDGILGYKRLIAASNGMKMIK